MGTGHKKFGGFTLVELMASVVVVMILVALALPRFRTFIAKGRQAEAINNLGNIHKLQKTYHVKAQGIGWGDDVYHLGLIMGNGDTVGTCDNSGSGQANTLGFRVEDCTRLRYTYSTSGIAEIGGATNTGKGKGANNPIYPGCTGSADTWSISVTGKLTRVSNAIEKCDK